MNFSVNFLGLSSPVLTLAILFVGCSSTYELPENSQGTSVFSGGVLTVDQSDVEVRFRPFKIDGQPIRMAHPLNDPIRPYTVEAGEHSFQFERLKVYSESFHHDRDMRTIEATLLPDKSYRVTGTIVIGNAIKYWLEDVETGEPVSNIYYDPEEIREALELIDLNDKLDSSKAAHLKISVKGFFADKKQLTAGRDCFGLIEETATNGGTYSLLFLAAMLGGGSPIDLEYGHRSYEDICLDVKMGHLYELKRFTAREDIVGVPHPLKFQNRFRTWYELWDVTEERMLKVITQEELKVEVKEFE
jgi:hypothetical protein